MLLCFLLSLLSTAPYLTAFETILIYTIGYLPVPIFRFLGGFDYTAVIFSSVMNVFLCIAPSRISSEAVDMFV